MLGAALLDAEHYPTITLTGTGLRQPPGTLLATMTVELKGRASVIAVPFTLDAAVDRLAASGTAVLRQSELGLNPFSVMLGALQVQDEITVKFKLVAVNTLARSANAANEAGAAL
jgi:polyisoprenoid-binding protein YceI